MFEPVIMFNVDVMSPETLVKYINHLQSELDKQQNQQADDFEALIERVGKLESYLNLEDDVSEVKRIQGKVDYWDSEAMDVVDDRDRSLLQNALRGLKGKQVRVIIEVLD